MTVENKPSCRPSRRRHAIAHVILTAVTMLLCAGAASAGAQTVRIPDNHPKAIERMTATKPAASYRQLDMKAVLAIRNQAALDKLLADQQDPSSPEYHHWLTPKEFQARFGPTDSDYLSVSGWLASEGFHIESVNAKDRYVRFSGTVAQAERVFGVTILSSSDDRFYGNAEDPAIPAKFAAVIAHIDGLSNTRQFVPTIRTHPTQSHEPRSAMPSMPELNLASFVRGSVPKESRRGVVQSEFSFEGSPSAFGPGDIYTFYDETPLLNQGINGGNGTDCIAVVEDSNYLSASVDLFDSTFSLAAVNATPRFPTTNPGINPDNNGDEGETLLDIEYAHTVAPGAPMRVYIGNPDNSIIDPITDGINLAVSDDACSAISISFASCGAPKSFFSGTLHPIYAQAASQGQSVFVSAGDNGAAGLTTDSSGNCVPASTRSINEMAADPDVTAVGGTEFNPNYDTNGNDVGFVAEQAWDEGLAGGATGGGVSTVFAKPSYQNGVTPADGMRDIPDIAIIASADMPGVFLGDDQAPMTPNAIIDCCDGGTSLSSPLWAGISRLIAQIKGARLGSMNPQIYQLGPAASAAGLRDVVTGNNNFNGVTGFKAGTGYDLVSGWGTPDINNFASAYTATVAPTPTPPVEVLALSTNSIAFERGVGTGPGFRSFKITNSGKGKLTGGLDLSGLAAPFKLTATSPRSFKLLHLQSVTETIQFTPSPVGTSSGNIVINSNDTVHSPTTVNVSGTAEPGILSGPSQLSFPNMPVNRKKVLTLVIKNTGPGLLSGNATGLAAPFKLVSPSSFKLTPGAKVSIMVQFAPTAPPTSSSSTLNLNSNGGILSVNVTGTGT